MLSNMMIGQVPPILAIKEANSHLKALHDRNQKLEREVIKLRATLSLKLERQPLEGVSEEEVDYVLRNKYLEAVVSENDEFLQEKDKQIACLKQEIQHLNQQLQEKKGMEENVLKLTQKLDCFKEAAKYKPALENLLACLEKIESKSDPNTPDCTFNNKSRTKIRKNIILGEETSTDVSSELNTSDDLNNSDFFNHISQNLDSLL